MNPVPKVTINLKEETVDVKYFDLHGKHYIMRVSYFKIDGDDSLANVTGYHQGGTYGEWWVKRINNEWLLHHDEFPAYNMYGTLAFFQYGYSIPFDQLNCDPTLKLYYTLKYDYRNDGIHHYYLNTAGA